MKNQKSKIKNQKQNAKPAKVFTILAVALLFALGSLHLPPVFASNDLSLSVAPPITQINGLPPIDVTGPLTIENKSGNDLNIQIILKPFRASDENNGQIEFLPSQAIQDFPDKNILQKIQILDNGTIVNKLELGPKEKKELQIHVGVPKNEPIADYYFSIIFLTTTQNNNTTPNPTPDQNMTTAQGGIASNLLLSIGPKDAPKGYIQTFSAPLFLQSGPVPFTLAVKNAGEHILTPKGVILIRNIFGQTIGRVDIAPANILANSTRQLFALPSNPQNPIDIDINNPQVIWPETFLLGPYSANLSLAMSDKGPIYTRTIHFLVAPIQVVIGIIVAISMSITIYLRIRKRLKS
jgi:hypothetical protein